MQQSRLHLLHVAVNCSILLCDCEKKNLAFNFRHTWAVTKIFLTMHAWAFHKHCNYNLPQWTESLQPSPYPFAQFSSFCMLHLQYPCRPWAPFMGDGDDISPFLLHTRTQFSHPPSDSFYLYSKNSPLYFLLFQRHYEVPPPIFFLVFAALLPSSHLRAAGLLLKGKGNTYGV